jgi:hypothetical protein
MSSKKTKLQLTWIGKGASAEASGEGQSAHRNIFYPLEVNRSFEEAL